MHGAEIRQTGDPRDGNQACWKPTAELKKNEKKWREVKRSEDVHCQGYVESGAKKSEKK